MPPHVRPSQRWVVYRNGQLDRTLQVMLIEESAGGKKCELAELIVDPKFAPKLQDFDPIDAIGSTIEIQAFGVGLKHWGTIAMHLPHFSPEGETIKYISRTEPHHFGDPAGGVIMFAPGVPRLRAPGWLEQPAGTFKRVDDEIVFNPEIDGRAVGNMHSSALYGRAQHNVFLDPEAVRTAAGRRLHGGDAMPWPISAAVHYLCWALNPLEVIISNPSRAELQHVFVDSIEFLRNAKVDDGDYLPEALDKLLNPLGYYWRLVKKRLERKFEFFRRGTGGRLVWLKHQRFGEIFEPSKTNVEANGVQFDASRLVNKIIGRGSKLQIEITAELVKAWPPGLDDHDRDALSLKAIEEDAGTTEGLKFAWRRWALNEGGDYSQTRRGVFGIFTPAVKAQLEAAGLLEWILPRRRKLLPTLTRDSSGTAPIGRTQGVEVEYRDSTDDAGEWKPIGNWGVELLEHEGGIYLNGDSIPEELIDLRSNAAVRVTATIETDFRITATAGRQPGSPLFLESTAQLDLDGDFHWRLVSPLSKYADADSDSIAVDDRAKLAEFVEIMRARWDNLDVAGNVVLEGVDQHDYQISDRVAGIQGRNVSFASRQNGGTHPQIVGLTYDVQGQKTIVHLERMREIVAV